MVDPKQPKRVYAAADTGLYRSDDAGRTWQLAEVIRHGFRDPFDQTHEPTMPSLADVLGDEEIVAVIAYFKSLWSPEHRRFQEEQNRRPPMPMQRSGW